MRRLTVTVPETASGRVDRFVADVSGLSRSYVQKLISEGHVTTAGMPIKANESIFSGQVVELEVPDPRPLELTPEPIPLRRVWSSIPRPVMREERW
jgi:23S rRNA pseudouridine1911/1915/1917 synthase